MGYLVCVCVCVCVFIQTFDIAKRLPLKVFNAHTLDIPQKFIR